MSSLPKPLTAEASIAIPDSKARSSSAVIMDMFFCFPNTSQKASLIKVTSSCSIYSLTSSTVNFISIRLLRSQKAPIDCNKPVINERLCSAELYYIFLLQSTYFINTEALSLFCTKKRGVLQLCIVKIARIG